MAGSDWDFTKYVNSPDQSSSGGPAASESLRVAGGGADFGFGGSGTGGGVSATIVTGRPPVRWLLACLAAVVTGAALAAGLGRAPAWAVAAWVLSGPVAIGLLAVFTTGDTRARAVGTYGARGWVRPLYVVCLVLCGLAVCLAALRIADWVGHL
jgi:hypothetical protein